MGNINNSGPFSYKEIEPLTDKANGPLLVRKNDTKEFFVKKCYPLYLADNLTTLQQIKQTNLPKVQEVLIEGDQLYLYEEFIHGKTLTEVISSSEVIETETILKMTLSLLDALIALHNKGLVHRDVKPGNIMLTNDGMLKLIDFDAVRVFDGAKDTDTIQLGTVGFASPEQFGFAESDARSDLYSVGVVINICSVKEYPKNKLSSDPFLREIILKATRFDPKDRYQSAVEMKAVVREKWKQWVNETHHNEDRLVLDNRENKNEKTDMDELNNVKTPIRSFLKKYVPGFRTDQPWKMTLAIIYYVLMLMGLPGMVYEATSMTEKLLRTIEGFTIFVLPVLLLTNFMNFHEKIPLLHSKKLILRGLGYGLLAVGWLIFFVLYLLVTNGGAKR